MARNEDRERLAEVHKTDLKDSNLNEDFVTWLKTKGPTWLLIIVAFLVAYFVMIRWQQQATQARDDAWVDLMTTTQPASLEDVARRHVAIDGIADQARLNAADILLFDVQRGRTTSADGQETTALDAETRAAHLAQAARLYQEVADEDDGSEAKRLAAICAFNGLAAVHESQGQIDEAVAAYKKAQARATGWIPALAALAQQRAATAAELSEDIVFATPPAPPVLPAGPEAPPLSFDPPTIQPPPAPPAPPSEPVDSETDGQ